MNSGSEDGFQIDTIADGRIMVVTWRGEVTLALWREFVATLVGDPRTRPGLARLHDFRAVDVDFHIEQAREMAAIINPHDPSLGRRRVAHLVRDDVAFGLFRMLTTLSEADGSDMRVFRDTTSALAWVGAPETSRLPADDGGTGAGR